MRYELHIAGRYLWSKRHISFINFIMLVSVIGITLGVLTLVVVMSVFNGFNGLVTSVLVGFDPHLRIEPSEGRILAYDDSLKELLASDPTIMAYAPFIQSKAILVSSNLNRVVYVKGVDDSTVGSVLGVRDRIVLGKMSLRDSLGKPGIVLGRNLADRLGATIGTEVLAVSPVGADAMVMGMGQPYMKKFRVTGIYDSNNKEYDAMFAFVALDISRRMFAYGDGVSGIEIRLNDIEDSEMLKAALSRSLGSDYHISTWYDLHSTLYAVMRVEKWSAYLILCLIIAVAMFNVLGSLTMSVITKRRDIGILKAIGATRSGVARVFLFEGIILGVFGTIIGTALGLLVCYLQIEYHLYPLDPKIYIIPAIPIDIRWGDVTAIIITSILFNAVASWVPATRAAKQVAVDAIRWE